MWKITATALLFFVTYNLYWVQGEVVPAKNPMQVNGTNCTHAGIMCSSDCKQVILCVYISGVLEGMVVDTCDADTFCNEQNGTCGLQEDSKCPDPSYQFKCTSRGFYPDPFDCHKYYVCGKPPGEGTYLPEEGDSPSEPRNTCVSGYAYDYLTTICKTKDCREPVVARCEKVLQTAALVDHPSMYYMCMEDTTTKKINPLLFRCPYGVYDASIYSCTDV